MPPWWGSCRRWPCSWQVSRDEGQALVAGSVLHQPHMAAPVHVVTLAHEITVTALMPSCHRSAAQVQITSNHMSDTYCWQPHQRACCT